MRSFGIPHVYVAALVLLSSAAIGQGQDDPGLRSGSPALAAASSTARAGGPIAGLTSGETAYFLSGQASFSEVASVSGSIAGTEEGLGPRFNLDSCAGCHAQPAVGGSSPPVNPQFDIATAFGARNTVPSFIGRSGPVREARFKTLGNGAADGGVHALYVISQRSDST